MTQSHLDARHPLLARCVASNDFSVWKTFLNRYEDHLRQGIFSALGREANEDRVADLMQEVFYRLLEGDRRALRLCQARSDLEIGAYLRKVSRNVARDHWRMEAAAKRGGGRLRTVAIKPWHRVADHRQWFEDRLRLSDLRRRFRRACDSVCSGRHSRRDRRLLEAAYLEGRSTRDIASQELVGLQANSVDAQLHRLRGRLRRLGLVLPRRSRALRSTAA